jgi:ribosomal protein S18 acetylase RimI-like enzyme
VDVIIASASEDDVEDLSKIIEEIEHYYGATEIEPFLERSNRIQSLLFDQKIATAVLARDSANSIVGMAAYSFLWPAAGATHSLYLKELFVPEQYRRQGVASQIIKYLFKEAASKGCSRVEWTTDSDNPTSLGLYKALGFEIKTDKVFYRVEGEALLS